MFNIGWVMLCWPGAPIEIGQDVGILIALYGLRSLNACRIVYTLDADDDADEPEHPARQSAKLER